MLCCSRLLGIERARFALTQYEKAYMLTVLFGNKHVELSELEADLRFRQAVSGRVESEQRNPFRPHD